MFKKNYFIFFLFGEKKIANAKNIAEIITIDAPIGKSVYRDIKKPIEQEIIPINGEKIMIFLKS